MSQLEDRIAPLIEGPLEEMGFELVRVTLSGGDRPVLQVMAERADDAAMTVEDCGGISRTVSVILDAEDPIAGAYTLEVSSPGIDRPLTRPKDFDRFAGFDVRVETREAIEGRRRFTGKLRGLAAGLVAIECEDGTLEVPLEAIDRARLVMTDELIAAQASDRG
jgi:ribosome maturation factor RimP